MISIGNIADWILRNRKNKTFKNQTFEQICHLLTYCANNLTMLCITEDNSIVGVVCCKKNIDTKVMFVYEILALKSGIIKQMLQWFRLNYPQYTLEAKRHGRFVKYINVNKLINKI